MDRPEQAQKPVVDAAEDAGHGWRSSDWIAARTEERSGGGNAAEAWVGWAADAVDDGAAAGRSAVRLAWSGDPCAG
jgi:hypothetical protein